ncbi:cupin domain-containing protein [Rhodococcus sp. ABRD24]|uniref:cupin domain-containing protein n=1 Tax=Rhodococcus sp. ABRD24 TaxID=2507582 RepID=UPI00103B0A29|nr:cupin domain-containing protein [Rhodococcus sp. ABRD24]QBJ98747.1 cupin domain-containing protein [Rhodococcus sp. ABRD24]
MRSRYRLALATTSVALAVGLTPATAAATPSSGVTGEILAQATVGNQDYILRKITIAPGGTTGWHFHDGMLYGIVTEGTLTHYKSDCTTDGIYNAGGTIVEPSGNGYVHMGRNIGSTPMVLHVLYVLPTGSPLSEDAPAPSCTLVAGVRD